MNYEELDRLKYRQLQKLAKDKGLKANLAKPVLIDAILNAQLDSNPMDESEKSKLNETFEIKEKDAKVTASASTSVLSKEESGSPVGATQEERFAQFFEPQDDDLVLTPRGSQKPRQYLPASELRKRSLGRTSSILTIPPDSPQNTDITVNISSNSNFSGKKSPQKKRVSTLMNPTASSALKSARKSTPKSIGKSQKSLLALETRNSPMRKSLVGGRGSITKKVPNKKASLSFLAQRNSFSASAVKKVAIAGNNVTSRSNIPKRKMPNFAKLHARMEDKMDNLNEYLSKKKDRMDAMTPGKSLKKGPQKNLENSVTKNLPVRKSPRNLPSSTFFPTVKSVTEADFNFCKKSAGQASNFKFTAVKQKSEEGSTQILTNITNNSKNFDLKASLAKPLGYKPHRGKLGTWNPKMKPEERIAGIKKQESLKNINKTQIKGVRMNKRAELLLQRRGTNA